MPSARVNTAESLVFKPRRILCRSQIGHAACVVIHSHEKAVVVVPKTIEVMVGIQRPLTDHVCVSRSIRDRGLFNRAPLEGDARKALYPTELRRVEIARAGARRPGTRFSRLREIP